MVPRVKQSPTQTVRLIHEGAVGVMTKDGKPTANNQKSVQLQQENDKCRKVTLVQRMRCPVQRVVSKARGV
jgi:hypothetical protein